MRAYLGYGSNLGDRRAYLRDAVRATPDRLKLSPLYESPAMGGPAGQGPYLNLVVELETEMSPRQLLQVARGLEQTALRKRTEQWGPRTLDVDILLVGELEVNEPDLVVPHPRIWERPFVVAPLADLAPDRVHRDVEAWARGQVEKVGDLSLI